MLKPAAVSIAAAVVVAAMAALPPPEALAETTGKKPKVACKPVSGECQGSARDTDRTDPPGRPPPVVPPHRQRVRERPKPPELQNPGPHCGANSDLCTRPPRQETKAKPKPKTPDAATIAREVVTRLKLTDPTPNLGPDPANNPWHMLTVGYPVWLWASAPGTLTTTATHQGLTMTLTATRTRTTYDLGDDTAQSCTSSTPYNPRTTKPAAPSPTCGHTYTVPSPVGRPYTITATDHWSVEWATNTQRGTLTTTTTGHTRITIGQLASLTKG